MDCSICYESMLTDESDTDVEIIQKLSCGHIYHTECIDKWININNTCPICREIINIHIIKDSDITDDYTYITIIPSNDDVLIEVNNINIPEEQSESLKNKYILIFVEIIVLIFSISTFIVNIIFQDNLLKSIQNYVDAGNSKIIITVINGYLSKIEIGLMILIILIKSIEFKVKQNLVSLLAKIGLISSIFIFHMKYNSTINNYIKDDSNLLEFENIKNVYSNYKQLWFLFIFSMTIMFSIDIVNFIRNHNFIFLKNCMIFCLINYFHCKCLFSY